MQHDRAVWFISCCIDTQLSAQCASSSPCAQLYLNGTALAQTSDNWCKARTNQRYGDHKTCAKSNVSRQSLEWALYHIHACSELQRLLKISALKTIQW